MEGSKNIEAGVVDQSHIDNKAVKTEEKKEAELSKNEENKDVTIREEIRKLEPMMVVKEEEMKREESKNKEKVEVKKEEVKTGSTTLATPVPEAVKTPAAQAVPISTAIAPERSNPSPLPVPVLPHQTQAAEKPDGTTNNNAPNKEVHEPPIVPIKDEYISPSVNEAYHEKILTLLKITNNKVLNATYCKTVPQISKTSLLLFDLSLSSSNQRVNDFEKNVLPENLMKDLPPKDPKLHYYQEFCQLTIANMVMQMQIKKLLLERQDTCQRYQKMQVKRKDEEVKGKDGVEPAASSVVFQTPPNVSIIVQKHKRHRRTANEIERHYRCPSEKCGKSYGSEGSLNQHIKLKHPELSYPQATQSPQPTPMSTTNDPLMKIQ